MKKNAKLLHLASIAIAFFMTSNLNAEVITINNNTTVTINDYDTIDIVFAGVHGTAIIDGNTTLNSIEFNKVIPHAEIIINEGITVQCGSFNFNRSYFTITNNGNFSCDTITSICTIINNGQLTASNFNINDKGVLTNNSTIESTGSISITGTGSVTNAGIFISNGNFKNYNEFTNSSDGQLTVNGYLSNYSGSALTNNGYIEANTTLNNYGDFTNNDTIITTEDITLSSGTISNSGYLKTNGSISISGSLTNSGTLYSNEHIKNYGTLNNNDSIITSTGYLSNYSTGDIVNNGNIEITGNISNYNTITNNSSGTIVGANEIINYDQSTLTNYGNISTTGSYYNYGETHNYGTTSSNNILNKDNALFVCSSSESGNGLSTCQDLFLQDNSFLSIESNCSVNIESDLRIESTPTSFPRQFISGNINISDNVIIEHTYQGDAKWQFQTVPVQIDDLSIYGTTFNDDYAIYYYDENERATNGHSGSCWKPASTLHPGKGYIFLFANTTTVNYIIPASEYLNRSQQEIILDKTTALRGDNDEGWNLIGNPYFIELDWDNNINNANNTAITNGDIGSAIYVYDTNSGIYNTYTDGISINGQTGIINPLDAFFVKSFENSAELYLNSSDYQSLAESRSRSLNTLIKITFCNSSSKDQTVFRFKENATKNFDQQYDALKLPGNKARCAISTQTSDGIPLAINTISPPTSNYEHDLYLNIPSNGNYLFLFNIDNPDIYNCFLIDKKENEMQLVENGDSLKYTLNTEESNRFMLAFIKNNILLNTSVSTLKTIQYNNETFTFPELSQDTYLKIFNLDGKLTFSKNLKKGDKNFKKKLKSGLHLINIDTFSCIIHTNN